MKRIYVPLIVVTMIFCISTLWSLRYNGKDVKISFTGLTWERMGGDVSALTTFESNVDLLVATRQVSPICGDSLKLKWLNGEKSKALIITGNKFHGEFYGGVTSAQQVVELGPITIGTGFDKQFNGQPASAWCVYAYDSFYKRMIYVYWFQSGLNGKVQCNNLCWRFDSPVEIKEIPIPEPYPVPGPERVVHDTLFVDVPVRDSVTVCKPCVKISGWTSFAHDEFPEASADSVNFGNYQLDNFRNSADGHFIFASEQEVTGKVCMDKCAIVANIYHEYEDGPHGANVRLGLEHKSGKGSFIEFGGGTYYRQFAHTNTIQTPLPDGSLHVKNVTKLYGAMEYGPYTQLDQFLDSTGRDHLRLFAWQGIRPLQAKFGTTELRASIKLEPERIYLFCGGKYQFTPYENVDTLRAPQFQHVSWEPRIGYSVSRDVILFLRHRGINHDSWNDADSLNSWSKYTRRDLSAGIFYRPAKMLGIKNLYMELITGYTRINERYKNHFLNRHDDLMEVKLTLFYNWKF